MELGIKGKAESLVTKNNVASTVGSGALDVFSTPSMIGLMEKAALESVAPYLEEGQGTVGIELKVSHLASTPVGQRVWAETELIGIDNRILTFNVAAYTDVEKIGEGTHKRCIIKNERFMEKTNIRYQ